MPLVPRADGQGSKPRGDSGQCRLGSEQEVQGVVGKVNEWTRLLKSKLVKLNDVLGCCDSSLCGLPEGQVCAMDKNIAVLVEELHNARYTTMSAVVVQLRRMRTERKDEMS